MRVSAHYVRSMSMSINVFNAVIAMNIAIIINAMGGGLQVIEKAVLSPKLGYISHFQWFFLLLEL